MRALSAFAVLILALYLGCGPRETGPEQAAGEDADGGTDVADVAESEAADAAESGTDQEGEDFVPLQRQPVVLYFPASFDDGLAPQESEIFHTASAGDRAKQILADLISGPNRLYTLRVIPQRTVLRQIYVTPDGTAWADFSGELRIGLGGGAHRERLLVYSIVDSLALNIPEILRVGLLIDGRPVDTLSGHVDLRRPLPPDTSLILEVPEELRDNEDHVVRGPAAGIAGGRVS